jgi:hypothetical protein
LSGLVFGSPVSPYELSLLRRDLCDPESLYDVGFPDGPVPPADRLSGRRQRLLSILTDRSLFDRGRRLLWVNPHLEVEALVAVQSGLRRKVGARGVVIEVNPISNLLIGDLGDLENHPLWRLQPPRGDGSAPPLSICIGSDDPITFASNLRHEYQFIADTLTLAGLSDEEAGQWIDRARACGLESRFTIAHPGPPIRMTDLYTTDEPPASLL